MDLSFPFPLFTFSFAFPPTLLQKPPIALHNEASRRVAASLLPRSASSQRRVAHNRGSGPAIPPGVK